MELLIVILILIIGLLTFLLLKKERVLGIKPETTNKNTEVKIVESKEYRKNIFNLLNSIPEGILILDKSKKIIFSNNSSTKLFDTKINENISGSLRNPDLLSSIDKIFEDKNIPDFEIEIRNKAVLRLNISIYLDKNNFKDVNVLEDDEIRQGIKDFSDWPTIPQLYVKNAFIGGADIITEMTMSGELDQLFAEKSVSFSQEAAAKIREENS